MVIRNVVFGFSVLLMSSCASMYKEKIVYVDKVITKEVRIPVYTPPTPPVITRPALAIDQLSEKDDVSHGDVVKAALATIQQLLGYSVELEEIIEGYR